MSRPQTKICFPTPKIGGDCLRIIMKVDPEEISYIVMIFEAYDFIGVPRTINRAEGIIEALVSPDFADDARALVDALKTEITGMEILSA